MHEIWLTVSSIQMKELSFLSNADCQLVVLLKGDDERRTWNDSIQFSSKAQSVCGYPPSFAPITTITLLLYYSQSERVEHVTVQCFMVMIVSQFLSSKLFSERTPEKSELPYFKHYYCGRATVLVFCILCLTLQYFSAKWFCSIIGLRLTWTKNLSRGRTLLSWSLELLDPPSLSPLFPRLK